MLETIFYYTWWIVLVLLWMILSIVLIYYILVAIKKLSTRIKVYAVFVYAYKKMDNRERQIAADLYDSMMKWEKEKLDKYFKL